jgi:hypothetical protein
VRGPRRFGSHARRRRRLARPKVPFHAAPCRLASRPRRVRRDPRARLEPDGPAHGDAGGATARPDRPGHRFARRRARTAKSPGSGAHRHGCGPKAGRRGRLCRRPAERIGGGRADTIALAGYLRAFPLPWWTPTGIAS